MSLEGASAALRCKGQMRQHLGVCLEIQTPTKINPKSQLAPPWGAGSQVGSFGEGALWLLQGVIYPPNITVFTKHLVKGDAEVTHLDF